jgi:hypothetical protein
VDDEFEVVGIKLGTIAHEAIKLTKEENNIHSQLHAMRKEGGMCFWPSPIMHLGEFIVDGGKTFITTKPWGYCNQWYNCFDITIFNYKHMYGCNATRFKQMFYV